MTDAQSISFRKAARFILFGGGEALAFMAEHLAAKGVETIVLSGDRHLDENCGGESLGRRLDGLDVRVIRCSSLDRDFLQAEGPNAVGVSFGSPWVFDRQVIEMFDGRLFNVHGTRLPCYRGGASYSWMIMQGDRRGASLLHQVDEGLDTGPVLIADHYEFPDECRTPRQWFEHAFSHDMAMLQRFAQIVIEGDEVQLQEQDHGLSTYYPRLNTGLHGWIDWDWTAEAIESFALAFDDPFQGAGTELDGETVRLKKVRIADDRRHHPFMAGLVIRVFGGEVYVASRTGTLAAGVVLANEERLSGLVPGKRFHTPRDLLEKARTTQYLYTANGGREAVEGDE